MAVTYNREQYEKTRAVMAMNPLAPIRLPSWEQVTSSQQAWDSMWAFMKGHGIDMGDNPNAMQPQTLFSQPGAPQAPAPVNTPIQRLGKQGVAKLLNDTRDICQRAADAKARGAVSAPRLAAMCAEAKAQAAMATSNERLTSPDEDKTKTYLMVAGGAVMLVGAYLLLRR